VGERAPVSSRAATSGKLAAGFLLGRTSSYRGLGRRTQKGAGGRLMLLHKAAALANAVLEREGATDFRDHVGPEFGGNHSESFQGGVFVGKHSDEEGGERLFATARMPEVGDRERHLLGQGRLQHFVEGVNVAAADWGFEADLVGNLRHGARGTRGAWGEHFCN
jgi:hypothetical protein